MLNFLEKYKTKDHFFFIKDSNLQEVCNAPNDKSGVSVVYALENRNIKLVFVGSSGEAKKDGTLKVNRGGLENSIENGKQFGQTRRNSWKTVLEFENIEALDVYWYLTHDNTYTDCPKVLENNLLQEHLDIYGRLPKWNDPV